MNRRRTQIGAKCISNYFFCKYGILEKKSSSYVIPKMMFTYDKIVSSPTPASLPAKLNFELFAG